MPLAGKSNVLTHHILILKGIAIKETIEAVIEVAFLALLLQEGTIHGLSLSIHHLNDLGRLSVLLRIIDPDDLLLFPPALPRELIHLELQRLDHRITDQLICILLWSWDDDRVEIRGESVFEYVHVGLIRRVGHVADRTVHELFSRCIVGLIIAVHHATVPINPGHHNNFI